MKQQLIKIYEGIYTSSIVMPIMYKLKNRNNRMRIMTAEQTISYIQEHGCSVSRFGEGELELIICPEKDLGFQKHSEEIAKCLEEVLHNKSSKLLICMPYALKSISGGRTRHSRMFWWHWCNTDEQLERTKRLIEKTSGLEYLFGDTQLSRPYVAFKSSKKAERIFANLKKLWDEKDCLFVEGVFTRLGVGNDLFSNAKSIKRILCPATNAFDYKTEIIDAVSKSYHGELIILALGPTATVVAAELNDLGMQALDLGHLDIEYEWFRNKSKTHELIPGKFTNEAHKGGKVSECKDEKYLSEILMKIGC